MIFDTSLLVSKQNQGVFNAVSSHMFSSPFMQSGIIDHNMVNTHEQIIASNSMPSNVQQELLNNLYIPNNSGREMISEGNSGNIGIGISLANLLPSDVGSGDNVLSMDNSFTSALAMNMRLHDGYNSFNSSYPRNHDCSTVHPSYHVIGSNISCWNLNGSNITLPGFSGDEIKCYKKPTMDAVHKERLATTIASLKFTVLRAYHSTMQVANSRSVGR